MVRGIETEGLDVFRTTELKSLSSIFHHEITIKGRSPICVQKAEMSANPPEPWHTGSYTHLIAIQKHSNEQMAPCCNTSGFSQHHVHSKFSSNPPVYANSVLWNWGGCCLISTLHLFMSTSLVGIQAGWTCNRNLLHARYGDILSALVVISFGCFPIGSRNFQVSHYWVT